MIDFIQYKNMELINIIKYVIPTLIDKLGGLLPFESMTVEEKRICQNNAKVRHIIMCVLSEEEMSKVHAMVSVKEMWDTLALTYEGSKGVKINKLTMLKHQYEMFAIEDHESIQSMISRLQVILNSLRSWGQLLVNMKSMIKFSEFYLLNEEPKKLLSERLKILRPCPWWNW